MKTYPVCGNLTSTSSVRPCNEWNPVCHKQTPNDMESFTLSAYVRSPKSFSSIPRLDSTTTTDVMDMITEKEMAEEDKPDLVVPNLLLIGAQVSTN